MADERRQTAIDIYLMLDRMTDDDPCNCLKCRTLAQAMLRIAHDYELLDGMD